MSFQEELNNLFLKHLDLFIKHSPKKDRPKLSDDSAFRMAIFNAEIVSTHEKYLGERNALHGKKEILELREELKE